MGSYSLYRHGLLPAPVAVLHVQETCMALLLIRPLLLYYHPQLHLYLVPPIEPSPLHCMLLPIPRLPGKRRYHMAQ